MKDGADRPVSTTAADAALDAFGPVLLEDGEKLRSADNVLPVVNAGDAGSPRIATAPGKITKALSTADPIESNRKADTERAKPADVAEAH